MIIDENKLARQLKGIERWRSAKNLGISYSNGVGILYWVTGMGKTFTACQIIKRLLQQNEMFTITIAVPSENLEKQWHQEVGKIIPEYRANITIITVHKLVELNYQIQTTLLIIDEIHEFYTEERLKIINGSIVSAKYKLGLTATFEDAQRRHKAIETIMPIVDRIDEEEALREGWVSKYIEYNIGVTLTEGEARLYKEHSDKINKNLNKFGRNGLELASKCLSGDSKGKGMDYCFALASSNGYKTTLDVSIPQNQDIINLWHPKKIMGYAVTLMESIRERKNVLYNAYHKLFMARDIVNKFNNLKTIAFSQSTHFADRLGLVINHALEKPLCTVYHSKLATQIVYDEVKGKEVKKGKTVLKREAIEGIKTGKFRVISTASSLDRGFDVKDISLVITTSGTQNPTQYAQRKGRGIRVKDDKEVIALIINIYVKNSQDEMWLRKRQSKTKNIIYWVDNIDDINYTPRNKDVFNIDEI